MSATRPEPMRPEPELTWDDVLADCEAQATHAETMLRSRSQQHLHPAPPLVGPMDFIPSLPRPSATNLSRILALQERQETLAAALTEAMRDIEAQLQLLADGVLPERGPVYLDRRM